MNTFTPSKIFRATFSIAAIITIALLFLTNPALSVTASDALPPTPTPDDGLYPTPTTTPTYWITPTPTDTPYPTDPTGTPTPPTEITPSDTPTPPTEITPSDTPTPTGTGTPIEPTDPPDIEITPTSFEISLNQGQTTTEGLVISNVGGSILNFRITASTVGSTQYHSLSFPLEKIEPGLLDEIRSSTDQQGTFLVYLTQQADLSSAFGIEDWSARGNLVFQTLQDTAQGTQGDLIQYLDRMKQSGSVSAYRAFYIVNAISVTAGVDIINELAMRPDVAYIEAEKVYTIPEPIPADPFQIDAIEWGVSLIRAPQVWSEFNVRGEGVVVANIDTGVLYTHPALVNQYRGTSTGSHNYNWYDPRGASTPFDNNGHGTHTMGTMVGSDGGSNQIGIAPNAKWIAAKGCYSSSCTTTDLLASAEWILAPYPYGGTPAQGDPNMRPNVVNNSWGGWGGNVWYQASVNAWRAANIFPAFSAGNSGPSSGTIGSPGDYAESFASGATDSSDVIASFSSRGPSSLTTEMKPDVSAPGVSVRSAYSDGGYTSMSGTSMASPHTAGCVALILSAAPNLDLLSIENLLMSTAIDLGSSGPDYDYGYGRIDCYQAVSESREVGVPWLTIVPKSGNVDPNYSLLAILTFDARNLTAGTYDAAIRIENNDPDENLIEIPVTLHVNALEPDIDVSPTSFDVTLRSGEETIEHLAIGNTGGSNLTYEIDVSNSDIAPVPQGGPDGFGYTFTDSNHIGGPAFNWIDISSTGTRLSLTDDSYYFPIDLPFNFNFYGTNYSQVAVASNGTLYFQNVYLGYNNTTIPSVVVFTPKNFIAVYWDDLNPSAGGAMYYQITGSEPNRKLIVQWQGVPHYGSTSDIVTAQAILFEGSNSILVQYLDPSDEAGSGATEGIQGDFDPEINWGLQYGYNQGVLSENLAICYAFPTMPTNCSKSTTPWLSVDPASGAVAPGNIQGTSVFINTVNLAMGDYSGTITIRSNDPDENPLVVPVSLHVTAPVPDIEVSPTSFEVTLLKGQETSEDLGIGNEGGLDLTFEIDISTSDVAVVPQGGGPSDRFGYTFTDSNHAGGPTFNWIDISSSGTRLSLTDDSYYFPIDLPFNFSFYGTNYSQVAVSSNGAIYFQNTSLTWNNYPIPTNNSSIPQSFIAVYWDDLNPSAGGAVYYQIVGSGPNRKLIVQWQQVLHYGSTTDAVTAQAILLEGSNSILVQYLNPSTEAGSGATEGIQGDPNPSTYWGLQYGYNNVVLSQNLAVCYAYPNMPTNCGLLMPSWLSVVPVSGTVAPGTIQGVKASFNASSLDAGTYSGLINIHSNDPDENLIAIPVTLHVTTPVPDIEITPTSFEVTLRSGEGAAEMLTISNTGNSPLAFELDALTSISTPTPFPMGGGNSDAFGYTFTDSNQFIGPAFNWNDVSSTGTRLPLTDDSYYFPVDLPFNFNFYGTNYSQVAVASNGTIYFQNAYMGLSNTSIPSRNGYTPQAFIAVYWDDLNPSAGGSVYYQIIGSEPERKLIIQWQDVPLYGSSPDVITAQAILLEGSNSILVQYHDPSDEAGSGATEGIQGDPNPSTNWGLQYGYNQAVLSQNLAICYSYPNTPINCGEPTSSWMFVSPVSGEVLPGSAQIIDVSFSSLNLEAGTYSGAIVIHSNDPDEDPLSIPVTLHVTAPDPDIEIAPTSFDVTLRSGEEKIENLAISNVGGSYLTFELEASFADPIPNPPGGPDNFGYTFIDSNDFAGPTFKWIDISASGTRLSLTDDSYFFPINLPFDFNFYGTNYTQVAVSSNGVLYFQNIALSYNNLPIPTNSGSTPRAFIAVYWDDLNPSTGGAVYYQITGSEPERKFIVQWQQVPHYGSTSDFVTAQAILLEGSNSILVQYLNPSNEIGSGATEGIQGDPSPTTNWGLQYGYNQAVLSQNLAICYAYPNSYPNCDGPTPPWFTLDPEFGKVGSGDTRNINININASNLRLGQHLGAISIRSNDPDENFLVVPVTLNVTAPEPDIEVTPTSFEVVLSEGAIQLENLTISNLGLSDLTFDVFIEETGAPDIQPILFPVEKIDPALQRTNALSANQSATFLVYLTSQANLSSAYQLEDWPSRGDLVFQTLQNTAQRTQTSLIRFLDQLKQSGDVSSYRRFYIVNAIAVTANLNVLNQLAARSDVAYIEAEKVYTIPDPIPAAELSPDAIEWGVSKIRAPQVWSEFNVRGEGVVVANIDTGVLYTHPALVNQYRGTSAGSHNYNWYDPRGASTPFDNNGHGTHTMGTMVGSDSGSNQIGIAPNAKWIAAKGCYSSSCTSTDLLASAEWILAPYPYGGTPAQGDPNMRPNVVNNSWGGGGGDLWYQASVNAWRAAGIFPAFSAGNSGPSSGTVSSPGDYAESFASGATDSSDVIASFSSRGPSSLTTETKPDVSAPGVSVRSAYNDGSYTSLSGTSMASPHIAGCVALILSAAPDLDLVSIENLLTSTAVDLGTSGPDYTYGYGRIDCYAAVSNVGAAWLRISPTSGNVSPGSGQILGVTFDASRLSSGLYTAMIEIQSNDPDEGTIGVPVTLRVLHIVE